MELPCHFDLKSFRKDLLAWWSENQRDYPWRRTRDPYSIAVAEVLLHRTRADQVVTTYREFLEKYPSVSHLVEASIDELRSLIYPLGLHWRVDALFNMAQELHEKFEGQIPTKREDLESLSGVSHYIATAIRCFAYGFHEALLDTNTVRICGRLLGIPVTDGSRRSDKFRKLLKALVDTKHPREFNYALLDHGALVCRSRDPLCNGCLAENYCFYARSKWEM